MKRIFVALLITSFSVGTAMAQSCATKAISKEGKPLTGAAKTSFIKKCKEDACESKAVSKDGKPLSGAAKTSFMKKVRTGGVVAAGSSQELRHANLDCDQLRRYRRVNSVFSGSCAAKDSQGLRG